MVFSTPYPWYIENYTHGILTPLPMVYRAPPYPWYLEPHIHGTWNPYPWYFEPPIMVYRTPYP